MNIEQMKWKAVQVFVNNAPTQWHVHDASAYAQWGKPAIAVCQDEQTVPRRNCCKRASMPWN